MSTYKHEAWFTRSAKLAIALAIIKTRPAGTTGREHAEYLAVKVKEQEANWKVKAEGLRGEVLRLRQDLLLTKLLTKQGSGTEAEQDEDVVKLLSQDLPYAQLSEYDSGCGTSRNTQTFSQMADPLDLPAVLPSASLSSSVHHIYLQDDTKESSLSNHMQFLQNLTALRRTAKNVVMDTGDTVVQDSALHMIGSVVEAYSVSVRGSHGNVLQPHLLVQASCLAAQALDAEGSQRKLSVQCTEKAEELLEELLKLLLSNSQLNKFEMQGSLTESLISLGCSSVLKCVLIRLVLTHVIQLAEQLWAACQGSHEGSQQILQVDWVKYQNSFYLLWILEQLLEPGQGRGRAVHQHLHGQFMSHILPLSDEFPLFAIYMWRIGGLLKLTNTLGT